MSDKLLTWQEKLDKGEKLSTLEEVKADADFNHKFRVEEQEKRAAFEAKKHNGSRPAASESKAKK